MKIDPKVAQAVVKAVQDEIQTVSQTLKAKGSKRFERALLLGGAMVGLSYYFVYLPPMRKLEGLQRRIDSARAMSQNTDAYIQARDRLRSQYALMPKTADKDQFLTQAIVETLRAEGLTSDSILPPDEMKESNLSFQQIKVSAQMRFPELIGWLARIEASKPFLYVTSLEVFKSKNRMGYCDVTVGVSTIIPTKDLTR
jgi:hypothetical protein